MTSANTDDEWVLSFNVAASLRTRNLIAVPSTCAPWPLLQCGRVAEDAESRFPEHHTAIGWSLQCGRVAEDAESFLPECTQMNLPRLQCGRVAEDAESHTWRQRKRPLLLASMWPRR